MVKMPRTVKRYSPAAGKHTEHTVERVRKRRASELKWGQRRFRRVTAGYRGFPRPKPTAEDPPTLGSETSGASTLIRVSARAAH